MGGKVMHAHFRLAGRDYYAMDAGPQFPFTEAVSLYVLVRGLRPRSTATGTH